MGRSCRNVFEFRHARHNFWGRLVFYCLGYPSHSIGICNIQLSKADLLGSRKSKSTVYWSAVSTDSYFWDPTSIFRLRCPWFSFFFFSKCYLNSQSTLVTTLGSVLYHDCCVLVRPQFIFLKNAYLTHEGLWKKKNFAQHGDTGQPKSL
jgi:hypothetical protein